MPTDYPCYNSVARTVQSEQMRTLGSQVVPARINELRRVLLDVSANDIAQCDPALLEAAERPLGREMLAMSLPMQDSTYVCLYNLEPTGFVVIHRSAQSAQVRALAVSPDMRRKGLARTMLLHAEERARERGLAWLWFSVPSSNAGAVRCARRCGFRRYRPQYLYRLSSQMIASANHDVYLQPLDGADAGAAIKRWFADELANGDAWAEPLVQHELMQLMLPVSGTAWLCMQRDEEIGCIHMHQSDQTTAITLWLTPEYWATATEMACLRALFGQLAHVPHALDVRLGSEGHLRAAVQMYKAQRFSLAMEQRVVLIKQVEEIDEYG